MLNGKKDASTSEYGALFVFDYLSPVADYVSIKPICPFRDSPSTAFSNNRSNKISKCA
ncbi:hypothetical protein D3C81_1276900 [compost metagenome]